jgi:hypothetical protein
VRRWIAAGALLVAAWAASPGAVPLYDGIGFPDEPYRYVDPPPGTPKTEPATNARVVVSVGNGTNRYADTNSREFGPQVVLHLPAGTMTAADGVARITVRADPLAPDASPPDGPITGNVYRVTAEGAKSFRRGSGASISLREPELTTVLPVLVHRPGPSRPWQRLVTGRPGQDFFEAGLSGTGDYALIIPAGAPREAAGSGGQDTARGGFPVAAVALGGTVAVMALVVIVLRRRRRA